jgi:two-component system sensor histidine kinase PilS (NtrC family)
LTGSFFSFFSFLYLVVIIYTSILLYRPGSLLIASVCSLEYGAVFAVDYFGVLTSLGMDSFFMEPIYGWMFLLFKIPITIVAFFAVAFLSSVLAEQAQGTKKELLAMEEHIKRVEKMAAVGEMAAGLAHEIKNPLASIMGSIHLINENQRYDPDQEHLAGIILREADRLTALVNNFLLFAKPPSISAKVIKIEQAVAEVVELFENDPSIQDRVEIIQNCHSTASTHMDPDHFRQILSNLLLNAAEAIKGYGKITIQTHLTPNRPIRLSIADTGCGIPPVNLKTIFNPFFTTKPKGTGLGLSIVHRILDAYHLRLNVDSQIHSGTTVSLLFEPIESSTNS